MGLRNKLVVVDDSPFDRAIITEIFKNDYEIIEFDNAFDALLFVTGEVSTISAIILDISMPLFSGLEALNMLKNIEGITEVPIIMGTAEGLKENVERGHETGIMSDFVLKPYEPEILRQRVSGLIEIYRGKKRGEKVTRRPVSATSAKSKYNLVSINEMNDRLLRYFQSAASYRGIEPLGHLKRVSLISGVVLDQLFMISPQSNLDKDLIGIIAKAANYHDIGLTIFSDDVLAYNGLDENSSKMSVYEEHTLRGRDLFRAFDNEECHVFIELCACIAESHHERIDGRGYPLGRSGEEIPLAAQVVGIAHALDDVIKELPKEDMVEKAVNLLQKGKCGTFDTEFLNILYSERKKIETIIHSNQ